MKVTSKTLLCASLAKSNRNSLAPTMHNAAFDQLGLECVYTALEPDNIKEALAAVRALKIAGGSISTPFKEEATKYVNELDETAKAIGAVNAFKNIEGKIIGYNSDWMGAIGALEEMTPLKDKDVAVLGAGGAARAIVYGLVKRGANVTVYNRTPEKGNDLASTFGARYGGSIEAINNATHEIIINATSVGKDGSTLPIGASTFKSADVLMDILTNPNGTQLMRLAEANGVKTIGGLRMLVLQGAFTFELITGQKAPVEVMYEAVTS